MKTIHVHIVSAEGEIFTGDATMVFAETSETVYYDACHHRESGCDQLMTYIGQRVAEALDR